MVAIKYAPIAAACLFLCTGVGASVLSKRQGGVPTAVPTDVNLPAFCLPPNLVGVAPIPSVTGLALPSVNGALGGTSLPIPSPTVCIIIRISIDVGALSRGLELGPLPVDIPPSNASLPDRIGEIVAALQSILSRLPASGTGPTGVPSAISSSVLSAIVGVLLSLSSNVAALAQTVGAPSSAPSIPIISSIPDAVSNIQQLIAALDQVASFLKQRGF
ncbi:hypothetical protein LXA43DRAFT_197361 [Ganoderma leucocontextum]|nr:hypothetical protein LXA43DRAFT_197361 [Ganoderma leucocontextum]